MEPKLPKWPFLLGDGVLLGAAWFVYFQSKLPMGLWQTGFVVLCVAGGAWLGIMPFLLEYRVFVKLAEARALATVTSQLQNLESLANQIGGASSQWQNVQQSADQTAAAAKTIAERMAGEVQAFTEFMQRINDTEKATLKLEVEKLRRVEAEWVQALVRILDHVYALNQGARRSGQPQLIQQLSQFEHACRDAARRVGLTPYAAKDAESFDKQRHQLVDGQDKLPDGAVVAETLASGYTFQGRLLRPALVRVKDRNGDAKLGSEPAAPGTDATQSRLALESDAAK